MKKRNLALLIVILVGCELLLQFNNRSSKESMGEDNSSSYSITSTEDTKGSSATSSEVLSDSPIVGTYIGYNKSIVIFKPDGRAVYYYYGTNNLYNGEWSIKSDTLTWNYDGNTTITAQIDDYKEFDTPDGPGWDKEHYERISDNTDSMSTYQCQNMIKHYIPDASISNSTASSNSSTSNSSSSTSEVSNSTSDLNDTVIAFARKFSTYSYYYIFYLDDKLVVNLTTNDTTAVAGTLRGSVEDGFVIKYNLDGGWTEEFVVSGNGKTGTLYDSAGTSWEFERVQLSEVADVISSMDYEVIS